MQEEVTDTKVDFFMPLSESDRGINKFNLLLPRASKRRGKHFSQGHSPDCELDTQRDRHNPDPRLCAGRKVKV